MEQMKIDEQMQIPINYEADEFSLEVRELRPVVFRDGESYCCLLGADPQSGVFGCGDTAGQAIEDWEQRLQDRMNAPAADDDELVQYVNDTLNASNKKVW